MDMTASEALTMEMREPWHRDLILGMIASCIDVDQWASSMAYTYSKSGTLEVTALILTMRAEIERLRGGREIEQTMLANVLPTLAANDAENEALRVEVASLRAFQSEPRAALDES